MCESCKVELWVIIEHYKIFIQGDEYKKQASYQQGSTINVNKLIDINSQVIDEIKYLIDGYNIAKWNRLKIEIRLVKKKVRKRNNTHDDRQKIIRFRWSI